MGSELLLEQANRLAEDYLKMKEQRDLLFSALEYMYMNGSTKQAMSIAANALKLTEGEQS